ncbi:SDR family NAD(P)-dependent oxidoreductase [Mycolicibacterium frederiksbergense]|uniref:SDR family oxidoreductase n=1 Tax=Mycolicibacterium frederiksbergense TaxID=117567 RepID=A0A6H0S5S2_9MYCO|nr:SDR family oxidoreductase [Mycolicibacterium frederiksbergense]MDO0973528.1 SDR family oxidoreductase [Mycolicibacterium frederiksbergense]QIV81685.1 SDR family oxidoreductase [Mycolicibacterium frederiksbergense]
MGQIDGKVALITGGSSGIGLATARSFAAEGAQVYLTGRRPEVVDAAAADITSDTGGDITGVVGDVSDLASLDALYAVIAERSGRLDVLVANAGSGRPIGLTDITEEHYDTTFDDNVKGLVFTVQKALPLLPDGASVVLMSSIAGISGQPGMSVYAATKAAIRNFARSWALELAPRGIRVSALCPGPVSTPGMSNVLAELGDEGAAGITTPFGRLGDAKEIAAGAVFLASDQSSFLTGSDLIIDGGANI